MIFNLIVLGFCICVFFLPWNKFTAMFQQKKNSVNVCFFLFLASWPFFVFFFLPARRMYRSEKKGIRPVHSMYMALHLENNTVPHFEKQMRQ